MVIRVFWLSILSPMLLSCILLLLDNWFSNVASVTYGLFSKSGRRDSNHPQPVTGISGTTSKEVVSFSRNKYLNMSYIETGAICYWLHPEVCTTNQQYVQVRF